jgi:hypothetical protein
MQTADGQNGGCPSQRHLGKPLIQRRPFLEPSWGRFLASFAHLMTFEGGSQVSDSGTGKRDYRTSKVLVRDLSGNPTY